MVNDFCLIPIFSHIIPRSLFPKLKIIPRSLFRKLKILPLLFTFFHLLFSLYTLFLFFDSLSCSSHIPTFNPFLCVYYIFPVDTESKVSSSNTDPEEIWYVTCLLISAFVNAVKIKKMRNFWNKYLKKKHLYKYDLCSAIFVNEWKQKFFNVKVCLSLKIMFKFLYYNKIQQVRKSKNLKAFTLNKIHW